MVAAAVVVAAQYAVLGIGLWCVGRALGPLAVAHYPTMVSTSACAAVLGLLAFFAPAGIGVREGIYLALLQPIVGAGPAAILTLLMRILQTVVELALGTWGIVWLKFFFWRTAAPGPSPGSETRTGV